jgi:hypothetical protein
MRKFIYGLKRAAFKISPSFAASLGISFRLNAPSRIFLERGVFGFINRLSAPASSRPKCLFIGLDKHNWHYPRLLKVDFYSIDIQPERAVYGSPGLHTVGDAAELTSHYGPESFDVIIANGLIGFGVDTQSDVEWLLWQCHCVMKPKGLLVLGYNETAERAPFAIDLEKDRLFVEITPDIPDVHGSRHRIDDAYHHVYVFARKPGAGELGAKGSHA